MINWLIKFLGGFTKEEYSSLEKEYNGQYNLVQTYRAQWELTNKNLSDEKAERQRLQEIIFKKFNVLPQERDDSPNEEQYTPINTAPRSWTRLRNAMEEDDRRRVKSEAS